MSKYRLIGKRLTRSNGDGSKEIISKGEFFEPTPAELAAFGDMIQKIPEAAPAEEDLVDEITEDEVVVDVSTMSIGQVLEAIKEGTLSAVYALEREQSRDRPRRTLIVELEKQIQDLR